MQAKNAVMAVLPELVELEDVDFSRYSSQYLSLAVSFAESGGRGLREFEEFVAARGLGKAVVGNFLLSVFQYLMIRYRRYGDRDVIKPAIKLFLTLKGWLNENGFENQWKLLLHNFVGYIVDMARVISEEEDCELALAYLTLINRLAEEAAGTFPEGYFKDLTEKSSEMLKKIRDRCSGRVSVQG
ncbi:hypothetical protein [Thermococcus gammatolerans]|uniref:hypothetical protein n=1 Tax=Thermococcus gammatolerans TaxID=187878 RepID=UPI000AA002D0|nr:hypothetical protein [Thermococcus gammatolerans]